MVGDTYKPSMHDRDTSNYKYLAPESELYRHTLQVVQLVEFSHWLKTRLDLHRDELTALRTALGSREVGGRARLLIP